MNLISSQPITLNSENPEYHSNEFSVSENTAFLKIRIKRPTTLEPLNWDSDTTLKVKIIMEVGGEQYKTEGQVTGGVRLGRDGNEKGEYSLSYSLPVFIGDKARNFMATAIKDENGFYHDVPLTRIGEMSQVNTAYVIFELVKGQAETEIIEFIAVTAEAPKIDYRNSVAFDAASSAQEIEGDGILSLSHTSTGSELGVFAGICMGAEPPTPTSTSTTYAGTSMTEMWNQAMGSGINDYRRHAGYRLAGQSTGAQTVTNTLSGALEEHTLGVISMTGVDQTTPVGTPVTVVATSGTSASVTVTSVGANDMVVDNINSANSPTVGANQTQRYTELATNFFGNGSTQAGSDGGVMSWTFTSGENLLGAVNFKASGGAVATPKLLTLLGLGT